MLALARRLVRSPDAASTLLAHSSNASYKAELGCGCSAEFIMIYRLPEVLQPSVECWLVYMLNDNNGMVSTSCQCTKGKYLGPTDTSTIRNYLIALDSSLSGFNIDVLPSSWEPHNQGRIITVIDTAVNVHCPSIKKLCHPYAHLLTSSAEGPAGSSEAARLH